jgi:TetR/AcrR family tetracycline transcriptional repressor
MALSREDVLNGALALLDRVGLDALSMRRLAQALGVQAGAIYWHFSNKQDLEDAMVDAMLGGLVDRPIDGARGRWQAELAELCRRMAAALLARRDGARLAVRALRPGPNGLALSERLLAILGKSGAGAQATLWAAAVVGYYVLGYVTDVQATEAAKGRGLVPIARTLLKRIDRKKYPQISAHGRRALVDLMSATDAQERFEFGLDVLLKGLSGARPRKKSRKKARERLEK